MSLFHENLKDILSDVEKFLTDTLKKEKLSKKSNESKQQILEKLQKFFETNPSMRLGIQDSTPAKEVHDDSTLTGGSSKSDDSEENKYIDPGIAVTAAADLKDPACSGHLEKKQKKGSGLFGSSKFQMRWCVVRDGIFYYYLKNDDKKQKGAFKLEGYLFRNAPDISSKKKELCFELYADDKEKRIYQFMAANKEEYEEWRDIISCGGNLIEEDIYEEVGGDVIDSLTTNGPTDVYDAAEVSLAENTGEVMEEFYEDPDNPISEAAKSETKPPTPPPPIQRRLEPPPPPPVSRSPSLKGRKEIEADDDQEIYEEASSTELPPPPPELLSPLPNLPAHGKQPQEPAPPTPRRPPPARNLPPLPAIPPESVKTKVKIDIKCKPDEDFGNMYYGKWDCGGDCDNELSFKKGEIVHILSREFDDKSWWVGRLNGKFGLVPKNFLTPAYIMASLSSSAMISMDGGGGSTSVKTASSPQKRSQIYSIVVDYNMNSTGTMMQVKCNMFKN